MPGDIVCADRLLAVLPVSRTRAWLEALARPGAAGAERIVPGHGRVADLPAAREQTRDCLVALRTHMNRSAEQGADVSEAAKSFDTRQFLRLSNAAELNPGNASRTHLKVERE